MSDLFLVQESVPFHQQKHSLRWPEACCGKINNLRRQTKTPQTKVWGVSFMLAPTYLTGAARCGTNEVQTANDMCRILRTRLSSRSPSTQLRNLVGCLQEPVRRTDTNRKTDHTKNRVVCFYVGTYLSYQAASSQVLSARVSLTAVFGMGTGVPSPSSAPTIEAEPSELNKETETEVRRTKLWVAGITPRPTKKHSISSSNL